MSLIGTIASLQTHPVKSMQGSNSDAVRVTTRGLEHDRALALIDEATGKVVSAKLPHRWGKMLECSARVAGDQIVIALPDGRELAADDDSVESALSQLFGRQVRLHSWTAPGLELDREGDDHDDGVDTDSRAIESLVIGQGAPLGGFFDFAPVHLISSASLAAVSRDQNAEAARPRRFRANIVIESNGSAFEENDWPGKQIAIGENLVLEGIVATPRCAVPTLAQPGLGSQPHLTNAIGKINRLPIFDMGNLPCLGAYAAVINEGTIRVGDTVRFT